MHNLRYMNWRFRIISLFAVLFVSLQTGALAHAAQYGDIPHDHDGMVCEVETIASEDVAIAPVPVVFEPVIINEPVIYGAAYTSAAYVKPQSRAPPPRAPPHISA